MADSFPAQDFAMKKGRLLGLRAWPWDSDFGVLKNAGPRQAAQSVAVCSALSPTELHLQARQLRLLIAGL